jgi:hypothetical protein
MPDKPKKNDVENNDCTVSPGKETDQLASLYARLRTQFSLEDMEKEFQELSGEPLLDVIAEMEKSLKK